MTTRIRLPGSPARPAPKSSPALRSALAASAIVGLGAGLLGEARPAFAACLPDPATANGSVICTGNDETGFDARNADNVTITTGDTSVTPVSLNDDDPALEGAILVEDNSTVTIGTNASITVNANGGYGIKGDDDNFIENKGTITLEGTDARAISLDQNTTGVLPNGGVNSGTITINGDRGIGIQSGDNSGVATSGSIVINGNQSFGLLGGNRTDRTKPANITNSGTIEVKGDDSFGMKFGDGWLEGALGDHDNNSSTPDRVIPSDFGIRNQLNIIVSGNRSVGLYVGDDANSTGNHDSLTIHSGTITVSGTDAIGISIGGNDLFDRFAKPETFHLGAALGSSISLAITGSITGDADSGPLVVVRDFVAGRENRIVLGQNASLVANTTNQGTPDRAIAIRGSNGDDLIQSFGAITGDIELNDGDDRFVQVGTTNGSLSGRILGGSGNDEVFLASNLATKKTFDLGILSSVEAVRIVGILPTAQAPNPVRTPWELINGAGYTGLVDVLANGLLRLDNPLTLGGDVQVAGDLDVLSTLHVAGDLSLASSATTLLTLDGTTAPLTVQGSATFGGNLVVRQGSNLTPSATAYRLIQADGGRTGEFARIAFPNASGTRRFSSEYDAQGLSVLFQDVGLLGVANTANQRSIAQYLVALQGATPGSNQSDLQGVLDDLTNYQDINAVYDALSAEAYDPQTTVSVEAGRKLAALLFDRPRECVSGETDPWRSTGQILPCHARRLSPFVTALGSFRQRDKFAGHARYDAQMGGVMAGVDFQPIGNLALTLAVSGQSGTINVANAGASQLKLAELTGAASYTWEGLRIQTALTWGHGFHDDTRNVRIVDSGTNTSIALKGEDKHESDRTLLATEIGYRIPVGPVGVEPIAGLDWAWMKQDGIRESKAGGFGLDVGSRNDQVGSVRGGVRLSTIYEHTAYLGPWLDWMTGIWRPTFDVAWRQYLEGTQRGLSATMQGGADTIPGFRVKGKEDAGGAEIGFGLRLIPKYANRLRLDLRYQSYVGPHTLDQDVVAQATLAF